MSDVCALEGCDEPIEQQLGAPPRKYCCHAHRAAARSRRAVARRSADDLDVEFDTAATNLSPSRDDETSAPSPLPSSLPSGAEFELERADPGPSTGAGSSKTPSRRWTGDERELQPIVPAGHVGSAEHAAHGDGSWPASEIEGPEPHAAAPDAEPTGQTRSADQAGEDDPEADEPYLQIGSAVRSVIDDNGDASWDGRGDDSVAGGQARNGPRPGRGPLGAVEVPAGEQGSSTAPSTEAATGAAPTAATGAPSGPSSAVVRSREPIPLKDLRKRPGWATPRTAVAAGIAAIMVLGGGTTLWDISGGHPAAESLTPAPLPAGGAQWLERANVALTSTSTQLAEIDEAQKRWQAGVGQRRTNAVPAEVKALEARKAYLESQRSILASQVAAWQNLQQSNAALATANGQLTALETAAEQPEQSSTVKRQLEQQRDTLAARSKMLRDQADRWQQDVSIASTTPMPDTTPDATSAALGRVNDLGRGGTPKPGKNTDQSESGSILPGRSPNSGDRERDLPGIGAPPRPDDDRPSAQSPARDSSGTVTDLTGPVTGLLTDDRPGDSSPGATQRSERGEPDSRSNRGSGSGQETNSGTQPGPVTGLADAAGDVVSGAGDVLTGRGKQDERGGGDQRRGSRAADTSRADDGGDDRQRDSQQSVLDQAPSRIGQLPGLRVIGDVVGRSMDDRDRQQSKASTDTKAGTDSRAEGSRDNNDRDEDTAPSGPVTALMQLGDSVYRVTAPNRSRSADDTTSKTDAQNKPGSQRGSARQERDSDSSKPATASSDARDRNDRSNQLQPSTGRNGERQHDADSEEKATSRGSDAATELRARSAFIREYAKTRSAQARSSGKSAERDAKQAREQAHVRADEARQRVSKLREQLESKISHDVKSMGKQQEKSQKDSKESGSSRGSSDDSRSKSSSKQGHKERSSAQAQQDIKKIVEKYAHLDSKDSSSKSSSSKDSSSKDSSSKSSDSKDSSHES